MKITIKNGVTIINTGDATGGLKNRSGHTGVVWLEDRQAYKAQIAVSKKNFHLGQFTNIEEAIARRKEAEKHRDAGTLLEWLDALTFKYKKTNKPK